MVRIVSQLLTLCMRKNTIHSVLLPHTVFVEMQDSSAGIVNQK
jgi:hypothetical protein